MSTKRLNALASNKTAFVNNLKIEYSKSHPTDLLMRDVFLSDSVLVDNLMIEFCTHNIEAFVKYLASVEL